LPSLAKNLEKAAENPELLVALVYYEDCREIGIAEKDTQ
jgi:hypothetical protein